VGLVQGVFLRLLALVAVDAFMARSEPCSSDSSPSSSSSWREVEANAESSNSVPGTPLPPTESKKGKRYYALAPWHGVGAVVCCGQQVALSYIIKWIGSPFGQSPKGFASLEDAVNYSQVVHATSEVIIRTSARSPSNQEQKPKQPAPES
jgi:hypothetical protein